MLSPLYVLYLAVGLVLAPMVAWAVVKTVRGARGGRELRRSMWQATRIRLGWPRLARLLDLYLKDPTPKFPRARRLIRSREPERILARVHPKLPKLRVHADEFGVIIRARTLAKVGLAEWQPHAQHLADHWGCTRVSVEQDRPGRLLIRAIRRDPLTVALSHTPTGEEPTSLGAVPIGLDEYARPVPIRLAAVPGIAVSGVSGFGKTSLINGLITILAPSPNVQLAVIDGKGDDHGVGPDYVDLTSRMWTFCGRDLEQARDLLLKVEDLRQRRSSSLREVLNSKNVWTSNNGQPGFTRDWPLVLLIIDESHTFMSMLKDGGDQRLRKRNSLAAEIIMLTEGLVKLGRQVGIVTVLATQKPTGDGIPTQIRDNCPVAIAFALKTRAAAVAALGDDISEFPDASPVALQDPRYVGVAVMCVEGRRGFTRIRTHYTSDEDTARIATANAHLTADPTALLPTRRLSTVQDPPETVAEAA
ncbi:MAG: FtsK/SpoIIIE domain-containing protein [Nocardioidaceae bacterium]